MKPIPHTTPVNWQTTATHDPNDPTPVLLYWPYWSEVPVIGELVNGIWWTEKWLGEDEEDPGPLYWMPLPDVPERMGTP